jgi:hypothetical protein
MTTEFLLLKAITNALEQVTNPNGNPTFALVDEFMGQYEDEEGNPLWTAPAALIELQDIEWQDETNARIQKGFCRFRVHFVDDTGYDDKQRRLNTQHNQNMALGVNALRFKRFKFSDFGVALDEDFTNYIGRKRTEFVTRLAETVVTIVDFECVVADFSLMPVWEEVILPIVTRLYMVDNELDFKNKLTTHGQAV